METVVDAKTEVWRNSTKGLIVTRRRDALGQVSEVVTKGGQKLEISADDRTYNQEGVQDMKYDPFTNGMLTPVRLLDGRVAEEAASNPNLLSEEDIENLLTAKVAEFGAALQAVTSEPVLRRMRDIAEEKDAPSSRKNAIAAQLEKVAPSRQITSGQVGSKASRRQG